MSASPPPPARVPAATASSNKPKSKKRKAEAPPEPPSPEEEPRPSGAPAASSSSRSSRKKPKQKKRRGADADDADALLDLDRGVSLAVGRMDPQLLADHAAAQTRRFAPDLSPVELADLYVPAGAVADTTAFPPERRTAAELAGFLERFAGGEEERRRLGTAPRACGAPHTLVVAGAGMRAADLVRAARKFQKKDNVVAKLFAKHFKLEEQVQFLKKSRTGIAVGTPARLADLMDNGALSVEHLRRIVIDASHIDQKKRGVMDMKETMIPLAKWLTRKEFRERYDNPDKPLDLLFF